MWLAFALLGAIISIAGMLLAARKWNLSISSIFAGIITVSLLASLPFLWIYRSYQYDWLLLLSIGGQIGLAMALALGIILYRFWRDPERTPPVENNVIVSAADGKVADIKTIPTGFVPLVAKNGQNYSLRELTGIDLSNQDMYLIAVDMNIMNVHVNRCPIAGDVKWVKHIPGKFVSLRKEEGPFINTRCTTLIANHTISIATIQIASRLVRKIDNYLFQNQKVGLGERLGMIRFGSLVAVVFPNRDGVNIEVQLGQTVEAGTSILARYLPEKK